MNSLLVIFALLCVLLFSVDVDARRRRKTKAPTSNCPVPVKGCSSQKGMYSCLNPIYKGCFWTCGRNDKFCTRPFNDPRFPEYGTPNANRNCIFRKGKGCCRSVPNCLLTESPTLKEPTKEPTPAPTPPTSPVKAPTKAPTVKCLPQPKRGCTRIKPHTLKQCLGKTGQFSGCCSWTPNADGSPGGACTFK